jgi:hypothetical protein
VNEFLVLVHENERVHLAQTPRAMADLLAAQSLYAERLRQDGRLRDLGRLRPSDEGKRIGRTSLGALAVTEGPFEEDGGCLALYFWLRAATLDDARNLAAECPVLPTDRVEVREVMKGRAPDGKQRPRGKVFGFAVLGKATSRAEWDALMDRIDQETASSLPSSAFLGGVRLMAPANSTGERRATFDGPFLESKEVLGGLFLLRMPGIDDAIDWAANSPYVVHGRLEVRERWRS